MVRWLKRSSAYARSVMAWTVTLTLLLMGASQATVLQNLSTQQLTQRARWVQVGEVRDRWSSWNPEKKMVYTYVKIRVDQTLKGDSRSEMLIRLPGGRTKDIGMIVHGVVSFRKGERALVFLQQDQEGAPALVDLIQAKYRIQKNPKTGEELAVFQPSPQAEFLYGKTAARGSKREILLQDLLDEIRSYVEDEEKGRP